MCETAVQMEPLLLAYVPDCFKARKMCDRAVRKERLSLLFVPDCFVTKQLLKILRDDNRLIEWYDGYKK